MSTESIIQIILSLALVISAIVSAVITWKMLNESRKMRLQKIEPHVIAFLKVTEDHSILSLIFQNIGEGCAKNVKVKVIKDYYKFNKEEYPISSHSFMKNGLTIMPPQYKCTYYLGIIKGDKKIDIEADDSYVEFEISCYDITGKEYVNTYKLPFNQVGFNDYSDPPNTSMEQIPYYLKEIKNELKGIKQR
jgi:hypothetical protein